MAAAKPTLVLVALAAALPAALGLSNAVVQWQNATEQVVRDFNISNQISAKYYALADIAQFQALLANADSRDKINSTAVTAFAAHYILTYFFPFRQYVFDGLIARQLANVSAPDKEAARHLAQPFAIKLIQSRVNDSTQQWAAFKPAPAEGPAGAYQFTPNQTFALYPQLANATTFAIPSAAPVPSQQFGATFSNSTGATTGPAQTVFATKLTQYKPLTVDSPQYYENLNITDSQGAINSTARRQYDTNTSLFWADLDGTSTINGHYFTIAKSLLPSNTSLLATAELFARLGAAQFDSNVVGWYLKHLYLLWRPITEIRRGCQGFQADPTWTPLLKTPAHPEYPSTHAVTAGASGQILARYFGADNITFTVGSEYAPVKLAPRTYGSFSDASSEVGWSRVYGGIHFPKSSADGQAIGKAVGDTVFDNFPAAVHALYGTS